MEKEEMSMLEFIHYRNKVRYLESRKILSRDLQLHFIIKKGLKDEFDYFLNSQKDKGFKE